MIPEVLHHIDHDDLMPPLMVIQSLAQSQFATLSDVKVSTHQLMSHTSLSLSLPLSLQPYIVKHLQRENEQIAKVTMCVL